MLRGFGGGDTFAGRYRDESQKLRFTTLNRSRVTTMITAATTFLPGLLLVGVVALSGELALARQLSAGEVVAFLGYATFLMVPINAMTTAVTRAMQAHVAAANIARVLEPETRPRPRTGVGGPGNPKNPYNSGNTGNPDNIRHQPGPLADPAVRPGDPARWPDRRRLLPSRRDRAVRPPRALRQRDHGDLRRHPAGGPPAGRGPRAGSSSPPPTPHLFAGPAAPGTRPGRRRLPTAADRPSGCGPRSTPPRARDIIEALPGQLDARDGGGRPGVLRRPAAAPAAGPGPDGRSRTC